MAGDEAVDVDLRAFAVAADLGARAARCDARSSRPRRWAANASKRKRSPEWEAEARALDRVAKRPSFAQAPPPRRARRRGTSDGGRAVPARAFGGGGGPGKARRRGARRPQKCLRRRAPGVFRRARRRTAACQYRPMGDGGGALNSANDFPTASAVCGGRAVTMEYAHSRAEVTFAVWTTSQQVAATVRAAVADDAFIASSRLSWAANASCATRASRSSASRARRTRRPSPGRPAASLGRSSHKSSKKSSKHASRRRAKAPEASSSRALGHRADSSA